MAAPSIKQFYIKDVTCPSFIHLKRRRGRDRGGGGAEKFSKEGGSMVQGQVTLKGGGGLAIFLFNFFKPERNLENSDN